MNSRILTSLLYTSVSLLHGMDASVHTQEDIKQYINLCIKDLPAHLDKTTIPSPLEVFYQTNTLLQDASFKDMQIPVNAIKQSMYYRQAAPLHKAILDGVMQEREGMPLIITHALPTVPDLCKYFLDLLGKKGIARQVRNTFFQLLMSLQLQVTQPDLAINDAIAGYKYGWLQLNANNGEYYLNTKTPQLQISHPLANWTRIVSPTTFIVIQNSGTCVQKYIVRPHNPSNPLTLKYEYHAPSDSRITDISNDGAIIVLRSWDNAAKQVLFEWETQKEYLELRIDNTWNYHRTKIVLNTDYSLVLVANLTKDAIVLQVYNWQDHSKIQMNLWWPEGYSTKSLPMIKRIEWLEKNVLCIVINYVDTCGEMLGLNIIYDLNSKKELYRSIIACNEERSCHVLSDDYIYWLTTTRGQSKCWKVWLHRFSLRNGEQDIFLLQDVLLNDLYQRPHLMLGLVDNQIQGLIIYQQDSETSCRKLVHINVHTTIKVLEKLDLLSLTQHALLWVILNNSSNCQQYQLSEVQYQQLMKLMQQLAVNNPQECISRISILPS